MTKRSPFKLTGNATKKKIIIIYRELYIPDIYYIERETVNGQCTYVGLYSCWCTAVDRFIFPIHEHIFLDTIEASLHINIVAVWKRTFFFKLRSIIYIIGRK